MKRAPQPPQHRSQTTLPAGDTQTGYPGEAGWQPFQSSEGADNTGSTMLGQQQPWSSAPQQSAACFGGPLYLLCGERTSLANTWDTGTQAEVQLASCRRSRHKAATARDPRPRPYRNEPPPGSLSLFFCAAAACADTVGRALVPGNTVGFTTGTAEQKSGNHGSC